MKKYGMVNTFIVDYKIN